MNNQDVHIVTLPPMRVASFYAFSSSPEADAWGMLVTWAKAHGCWQDAPTRRIFGFNNPDPSAGSPNYGYEYWLTIGREEEANGPVNTNDISGGMYAVLHCEVLPGAFDIIGETWRKLVKWLESSHYQVGSHQWLEEHLTRCDSHDQGFVLDLYLPITE